jgi:transcriptional regulator with XRE-family HTH domain
MSTVAMVENFLENLRAKCEDEGINQRELSRRSGVHYTTVNRILQGVLEPSVPTCEKLAQAAGIPISKLFLPR